MPISTTDTRQLIRQWLLRDPAIEAEVDGVFGSHLASADAQTVIRQRPVVIFEFLGGSSRFFREFEQPSVELYVYTKGPPDAALQVYDLVYKRLAAERIQVPGIGPCGSARELERPHEGRNEEIAAFYVKSLWTFYIVAGPEGS